MKIYSRSLDICRLLEKKSFFLFGPRSTGKTTLIKQRLSEAKVFDLLDGETFSALARRPKILGETHHKLVVIDEIQKLPQLLDEVHRLIESKNIRFLLTGSSARKLKRGAANLLAGRAWQANLFSLLAREIEDFDLIKYLNRGGLPQVYSSNDPIEELESYTSLYLQEEVHAEALVRNIGTFSRFLDVISLTNGEEINYQSISSDCGVPVRTLSNYISILKDTLIAYSLEPYRKTKKRKAITREKLFLFDIGVTNILSHRGEIKYKSELFGRAFEHFIINEVNAWNSYNRSRHKLHYWRSTSKFEVDLIIGDWWAIEIKSTDLVTDKHLKGIRALKEEGLIEKYAVVSMDREVRRTVDGVDILPWQTFLNQLKIG